LTGQGCPFHPGPFPLLLRVCFESPPSTYPNSLRTLATIFHFFRHLHTSETEALDFVFRFPILSRSTEGTLMQPSPGSGFRSARIEQNGPGLVQQVRFAAWEGPLAARGGEPVLV
jgi:hypothetical protein